MLRWKGISFICRRIYLKSHIQFSKEWQRLTRQTRISSALSRRKRFYIRDKHVAPHRLQLSIISDNVDIGFLFIRRCPRKCTRRSFASRFWGIIAIILTLDWSRWRRCVSPLCHRLLGAFNARHHVSLLGEFPRKNLFDAYDATKDDVTLLSE